MGTLWFCLVAAMLAMYVIFDGFDLGAGALHLLVARTEEERRTVLRSIGPVWDGNEVWLLAAGGTLYFAFPALYASSFSGFYLPLMIVLWLLILRGISIEFRSHVESAVWRPLWDVTFSLSSLLLVVFFGAALGNVVRGVPLDESGRFFCPLWTDFRTGLRPGILDWYTVPVGVTALAALSLHGALWLTLKTREGRMHRRARAWVRISWFMTGGLTVLVTALTLTVQPQVGHNLGRSPEIWVFPAVAVSGLAGVAWYHRRRQELRAFLASCAYLAGMLSGAAAGLYPYVLPASGDRPLGLTIENTKAADFGLRIGLAWWIPGMLLTAVYFVFTYRRFAGKVTLERGGY
ncbi:MAG TPA: cytochrome d ubiquinol oxidase subunit II [Candidatus Polarisedimenticolaceae bacterium]|nr:cytochrome d ubiquinol oxidase subunit II [Candidatus Polarisedimenticolaceae bacterium]